MRNAQRKWMNIGLWMLGGGGALLLLGFLWGLTDNKAAQGLVALGVAGVSIGFALFVSFRRRALLLDEVIAENKVLARWTFDPESWKHYLDEIYRREVEEYEMQVKIPAWVVAGIGLFFSIGACTGSGPIFGGIIFVLGVGVTIAVQWWPQLVAWYYEAYGGEILIARECVVAGGWLYFLDFGQSWLDEVRRIDGNPGFLVFKVSYGGVYGRRVHEVRVPIPPGCEAEAEQVMGQLKSS